LDDRCEEGKLKTDATNGAWEERKKITKNDRKRTKERERRGTRARCSRTIIEEKSGRMGERIVQRRNSLGHLPRSEVKKEKKEQRGKLH